MIYIVDNFLPENLHQELSNYSNNFEEVKTTGKSFWVKWLPEDFTNYIVNRLESIENRKINSILCFLREAKKDQDNDWRIHNDTIIQNQQPDRAIVLYIKSNEEDIHGTAFWVHNEYGYTYVNNDDSEFDRMLLEDANDESKWKLNSIIGCRKNRLISYPCEYFHSKYPKEYENQRVVLVMFYKYKE